MIHLKNSGYVPTDAKMLLAKADKLTTKINSIVRDMRVSTKYLEFDVSVKKETLDEIIERFESIGILVEARQVVEEKTEKEEAIQRAKNYFNNERYWECHEVLESVWKKTVGGEKDLVQGIILIAAGLVHYQKDENEICLSIMIRAMEKLVNASDKYYYIDIAQVKKKVSRIISSKKIQSFMI